MKNISRSLIGATAIHGIYHVTTFAVGHVKTKNYKPDFEAAWANTENLSNEVAFGYAPSPFSYAGAFLGTVLTYGLLLSTYEKFSSEL